VPQATSTKGTILLRLAKRGMIRARDLDKEKIPRALLKRLCDRGELERVDRGLYRLPGSRVTEHHALVEMSVRVPQAVVCLLSALQVHGLTTEAPHEVWTLIDNRARRPKLDYPPLKVVRASGKARSFGVETHTFERTEVRVTTPAKTVADCFRYRRHVGLEVALAALRDYLRKHPKGIDELLHAAKADRISTVVRPYLEALA
jgi:predicted transcriptional regulator of viral defense system